MSIRLSVRVQVWEEDHFLNILHPIVVREATKELEAPQFSDSDIQGLLQMIKATNNDVTRYWKEEDA